jgi:Family of unknown function (DUF6527)
MWTLRFVNQFAYQYYVPCIGTGVVINVHEGKVTHIDGRVQMLARALGCLVYRDGILSPNHVRWDLSNEAQRRADPYFLGQTSIKQPAVISPQFDCRLIGGDDVPRRGVRCAVKRTIAVVPRQLSINLDPRSGPTWRLYQRRGRWSLFPSIDKTSGCRRHFILWGGMSRGAILRPSARSPSGPILYQIGF